MTAPMTRPLGPLAWWLALTCVVILIASPFARSHGFAGLLARLSVLGAASGFAIFSLIAGIRRHRESRNHTANSKRGDGDDLSLPDQR